MTVEQTAVNHRALMAAAAKLEHIGYIGDAYRFAENLVLSVIADGYRRIDRPPPARGTHSTPAARAEAIAATRAAVDHARRRHTANEEDA